MTQEILTLRLRRMAWEADGVLSLEFVAPDGSGLPMFEPGAHVDLHMPDGQVRQYSLCGDPLDAGTWRVAVRAVPGGRVSRAIHDTLRPGALMPVGLPRNNFPFVASPRYLFIAGGIGITPLLPMLREATRAGARWTLLFCVKRHEDAPFLDEVRALTHAQSPKISPANPSTVMTGAGPSSTAFAAAESRGWSAFSDHDGEGVSEVVLHASERGTRLDVPTRLAAVPTDTLLYCCGPDSLMTEVEAATQHWPEGTVRFEWFAPRARPENAASDAFMIHCAESGITLTVPPQQSVLDALASAGIDVPRSCEQGICGTCECRVLQGDIDHRDSILSAAERAANNSMMVCVSRAKSASLVLDL